MLNKNLESFRETSHISQFWFNLRKDIFALISVYLFVFLLFLILGGKFLAPYSPHFQFIGLELTPPSWNDAGHIQYFLGTDDLGRDVFSRILCGFYYTVGSAFVVAFSVAVFGGVIGVLSGTREKSYFVLLNHLFDIFLVTPTLLVAIIFAILLEPSLLNAMLAIFLAMLPHFIHKIYLVTQKELQKEYVITLKLDGATRWDLIRLVIIPNLTIVAIKESSYIFILSILDISALSFISLGAQYPTPEWGAMIRDSMELIFIAPWTVILPGIAIIAVILIVRMLSNSIIRVLDKH